MIRHLWLVGRVGQSQAGDQEDVPARLPLKLHQCMRRDGAPGAQLADRDPACIFQVFHDLEIDDEQLATTFLNHKGRSRLHSECFRVIETPHRRLLRPT
jgi:hypothetical protein